MLDLSLLQVRRCWENLHAHPREERCEPRRSVGCTLRRNLQNIPEVLNFELNLPNFSLNINNRFKQITVCKSILKNSKEEQGFGIQL